MRKTSFVNNFGLHKLSDYRNIEDISNRQAALILSLKTKILKLERELKELRDEKEGVDS